MRFVKATGLCCCQRGGQALPAVTSPIPKGEDESVSAEREREREWKKPGTETDSVRERERVRRNRRNEKTDWHNVSISLICCQRGDRFISPGFRHHPMFIIPHIAARSALWTGNCMALS